MGRPKGSRNEGYDEERARLADLVLERLSQPDGPQASFRELARSCEVTPPTLRHYFGDHDGAIRAALERAHAQGMEHLEAASGGELGEAREALEALLRNLVMAWSHFGVGDVMRAGLEVGMGHEGLGPVFIEELLEPLLQAFERRIATHIERGELRAGDPRYMSLALLSPLVLALLHQRELGGTSCRPLSIEGLVGTHLDAYFRAWGPAEALGRADPS